MTSFQKIAAGLAIAMVATALFLPGRGPQETAVFNGAAKLASGSIKAAEGQ